MTDELEAKKIKDKAIDVALEIKKEAEKTALKLIQKANDTEHLKKVNEQFEIHEAKDQERFEAQGNDIKKVFVKVSEVIGETNEHIKDDKEIHKNIMEDLKDAKKDINTLKIDVAEVRTDVSWIRKSLETNSMNDVEGKKAMVTLDRFKPVERIAYGIIGTVGIGFLLFLISKVVEILHGYFK